MRSLDAQAVAGRVLCAVAVATIGLGDGAIAADEAVSNPYADVGAEPGSGVGKRIGYISLNEAIPFVQLVTSGIVEQASVAGAELLLCDSKAAIGEAIACAQQLAAADVHGVLNFQLYEDAAPDVCRAHGGLPTIAIDIRQPPCEVAFTGVDNRAAGLLVGTAVGEHVRRELDCRYDTVVVLGAATAGDTTRDRMDAAVEGFSSVCGPIAADRLREFDADVVSLGDEVLTTILGSTPPGGTHIVLAVNGDTALGALRAARALGREGEVLVAGQGADPSTQLAIACDPRWVADVAYFPERYGRTLIPAMIDILDGKDVPAELLTQHVAVDAGNIRELYPETPPCP